MAPWPAMPRRWPSFFHLRGGEPIFRADASDSRARRQRDSPATTRARGRCRARARKPPEKAPWAAADLSQVPLTFERKELAVEHPKAEETRAEEPEAEPQRLSKLAVAPSSATLVPTRKKEPRIAPRPGAKHALPDFLDPYQQLDLLTKKKPASTGSRLFFILPLAALLGCGLGYWGYLQLPSPIIPLNVRGLSQTVLVSWPADQTRNAGYAAVRVNDSVPVQLSSEQKSAGQLEVSASPDIKIELIARNWMRDSRGIVRFVRAANPPSPITVP